MNRFVALLKLTRIEHSIMLIVAVLAAELLSGRLPGAYTLALSILVPIFISAGAFAINDYYDIAVDRKNGRRDRPLVNGSLKPPTAVYTTVLAMVVGIAASALINFYCFAIAVIFALLAAAYAYKLKEILFWGNAYIAASMAIPFIFGAYVIGSSIKFNVLIILFIIFLSGLAREIDGSIRDLKGDTKVRNARTIPRVVGKKAAASLAFSLYVAAILLSVYLFVYLPPFKLNYIYLILIAVCDALLVYSSAVYFGRSTARYRLSRNMSLAAMSIALLSFLVAPLV